MEEASTSHIPSSEGWPKAGVGLSQFYLIARTDTAAGNALLA